MKLRILAFVTARDLAAVARVNREFYAVVWCLGGFICVNLLHLFVQICLLVSNLHVFSLFFFSSLYVSLCLSSSLWLSLVLSLVVRLLFLLCLILLVCSPCVSFSVCFSLFTSRFLIHLSSSLNVSGSFSSYFSAVVSISMRISLFMFWCLDFSSFRSLSVPVCLYYRLALLAQ